MYIEGNLNTSTKNYCPHKQPILYCFYVYQHDLSLSKILILNVLILWPDATRVFCYGFIINARNFFATKTLDTYPTLKYDEKSCFLEENGVLLGEENHFPKREYVIFVYTIGFLIFSKTLINVFKEGVCNFWILFFSHCN